jgi:hypothetical protein
MTGRNRLQLPGIARSASAHLTARVDGHRDTAEADIVVLDRVARIG